MKQHFVPILSLKHFAGPSGKVWTYDKDSGRKWSAIPVETGKEAHYYSVQRDDGTMDTGAETALAEVESDSAKIYEAMVGGQQPTGDDRQQFALFLGVMYARSPRFRQLQTTAQKRGVEAQMAAIASHPRAFAGFVASLAEQVKDVSDPSFLKRVLTDLSHSNLVIPKAWALEALLGAVEFANIFYRMGWTLAFARHHFFITCDSPMFKVCDQRSYRNMMGDGGLINRTAEVTMPLSKDVLLVMHWEPKARKIMELPRRWVEIENRKRAFNAVKQVYAHLDHKDVQRMTKEYRAKGPAIRFHGLGPERGFHSAFVPRRG